MGRRLSFLLSVVLAVPAALGNGIPNPDLRAFGKLLAARLAAAKL